MQTNKINAPNSILDFKQYIFCDFGFGVSFLNPKLVKTVESNFKYFKYLNLYFKKDIPYFEMSNSHCPHCGTHNVVKYGFTTRKLIFKETKDTEVKVQRYKCQKCGKTFQTDLSSFVSKNSNFTDELKNFSKHLVYQYFGSLKKVSETLKKEYNISVSHQTINNWLNTENTEPKQNNNRYSGYYVFDVEWIKINGKWKYRHTLMDSVSNQIIADKIYDTEDIKTVQSFLNESTRNKNRIAITTDLDKKYSKIIEKLGFKHQLCIFHTKKNLNKTLKQYLKQNNVPKEESKESWNQLQKIKEIFDIKNYEKAEKELQSLIFRKNEFTPIIYKIIKKLIVPRYKKFIYYLKDKKIERTSNKIENAFQKTMPKHKKTNLQN